MQKRQEWINWLETMKKLNGRKKILLITDVFRIMAGSERNITNVITSMDPNNFEFVVASFSVGKLAQDMREKGFTVLELKKGGLYTINGMRNLLFLYKLVPEKNISLIVTYHEASDFHGLVLSKACRVPIISNRRDMGFKTKLRHNMAYKLFGKLFNAAITVSEAVKKEMLKQNWFQANRVFTIYNGVDTKEYKGKDDIVRIKQSIGIGTTHPVVGMVANLRKIKGIRHFIEAAAIISKKNSQVQFLIIGVDMHEPGCTKGEMELFAKHCDVDKNVHFLGKRTDVSDLISIMDIGVIASLSEGFSNAVLEYMASSKPVVATDVGGNREAVLHCETGLLVPPADSNALASAILTILEDKETALRFGIAGKKRVEERFSLDIMLRKYENLFEQVINSRGNVSPPTLT